jgi:hypothetical protein
MQYIILFSFGLWTVGCLFLGWWASSVYKYQTRENLPPIMFPKPFTEASFVENGEITNDRNKPIKLMEEP